tara:strand:+ start:13347 stop:13871 length:525 start_codon:yes stop_codon:yes gene_type:complete
LKNDAMNLGVKWGLLFLFSISIFSFSAVLKISCKKNPFQDLDSLQITKKVRNFVAIKPVGWYSNQSSTGALGFSIDREKTLESNPPIIHHLDNINTKRNVAYISITNKSVRNQCKIETTLDDYLHFFISNKKKWAVNKEFNYILLKTNHSRYGNFYIVKYSYKNNSIIQKGKNH